MLLAGLVNASWGWTAYQEPHLVRSSPQSIRATSGERVSLVCWNLHKRTDSVLVADLANLLDSTRADLGLFQEAVVECPSSGIARAVGVREWALSANLFQNSPPRDVGVVTASSSKIEDATALLSADGEPVAATRKAALITKHPFGSRTLLIVNLHALNFSPRLGGFRRQLAAIADRVRGSKDPVVAAGDFNTWSRRKRDLVDSLFASVGLVRLDFGIREARKTTVFGLALDQIYYTPDRLQADPTTLRVHDGIRSSDHFPLSATFRFRDLADSPPIPSATP